MKAEEIKVGNIYLIRHFGEMSKVRVEAIDEKDIYCGRDYYSGKSKYRSTTRYRCVKLSTGRKIVVKSAAKFRKLITGLTVGEAENNPSGTLPVED